jgi:hypothetical protein
MQDAGYGLLAPRGGAFSEVVSAAARRLTAPEEGNMRATETRTQEAGGFIL